MRARIAWVAVLGSLALLAARCYDPNFTSGETKCSAKGECPSNWKCQGSGLDAVCVDPNAPTGGGGAGSGGNGGTGGSGGAAGRGGTTGGSGGAAGRGGTTGGSGGGAGYAGTGGNAGSAPGRGGTGGGSAGMGATAGSGGSSSGGSAGTGGSPGPRTCVEGVTNTASSSLITDFADVVVDSSSPGDFRFGSMGKPFGGTSRFASGTKGTLSVSNGALTFVGSVEPPSAANMYPFNGFAVYIDGPACVNATAYTGVSFSVAGAMNGCKLEFGIHDADHLAASLDHDRGLCSMPCYSAAYTVPLSSAPTTVQIAFNSIPNALAAPNSPVNAMKLTGAQWVIKPADNATTSCMGAVTIDDVRFYTSMGGATGTAGRGGA